MTRAPICALASVLLAGAAAPGSLEASLRELRRLATAGAPRDAEALAWTLAATARPGDAPAIAPLLQDRDRRVRLYGAWVLDPIDPAQAAAEMAAQLRLAQPDENGMDFLTGVVIEGIAHAREVRALPALVDYLAATWDPFNGEKAVAAIRALGPAPVLSRLRELAQHGRPLARLLAALALVDADAPLALATLRALWRSPPSVPPGGYGLPSDSASSATRHFRDDLPDELARAALPGLLDVYLDMLNGPSPLGAVRALVKLHAKQAAPRLVGLLSRAELSPQDEAVVLGALEALGDPAAIEQARARLAARPPRAADAKELLGWLGNSQYGGLTGEPLRRWTDLLQPRGRAAQAAAELEAAVEACRHWTGEPAGDAARAREIQRSLERDCRAATRLAIRRLGQYPTSREIHAAARALLASTAGSPAAAGLRQALDRTP